MRTAILIVSTAAARQDAPDELGPVLAALAEEIGGEIARIEVVPDDAALLEDRLNHFVDDGCTLVLTAGGAGPATGDVTPEATWAVIERETPGVPEAIRAADPELLLFRGVAGFAGPALIVNLPSSLDAARRAFAVIAPLVARA